MNETRICRTGEIFIDKVSHKKGEEKVLILYNKMALENNLITKEEHDLVLRAIMEKYN